MTERKGIKKKGEMRKKGTAEKAKGREERKGWGGKDVTERKGIRRKKDVAIGINNSKSRK